MRKLILFVSILLIASFSGYCKNKRTRDVDYFPRNDIYIQYGAPSVLELMSTLGKQENQHSDHPKFTGVGGFGYHFSASEKLSFGIYGGVSKASAIISKHESNSNYHYKSEVLSYAGMLSGTITYMSQGPMQLSSSLYLGVNYRDETNTPHEGGKAPAADDVYRFAYHITALKFRYGETFGAFAELGFGCRGILNIGLSIQL